MSNKEILQGLTTRLSTNNTSLDDILTIVHMLPDNSTSLDVYSTEEQIIGTYINGEPLYRKVVVGTLDGSWSEGGITFSWIDLGIKVDKVPRLDVSLTRNEEFTYTEASNKDMVVSLRNGRGGITTTELQVGLTTSMFANQEIDIIIEYTKKEV